MAIAEMAGVVMQWVLRASWQAAVIVAVILIAQAIFGKQLGARWRYALWILVILRLTMMPVAR